MYRSLYIIMIRRRPQLRACRCQEHTNTPGISIYILYIYIWFNPFTLILVGLQRQQHLWPVRNKTRVNSNVPPNKTIWKTKTPFFYQDMGCANRFLLMLKLLSNADQLTCYPISTYTKAKIKPELSITSLSYTASRWFMGLLCI